MRISSEEQMINFARRMAPKLMLGDVICLEGELGVGKSVFARALIRALCKDAHMDVPSPSFTLVQEYEGPMGAIVHIDAYRLSSSDELYELGWPEQIDQQIAIIEWPDRLGELTPARRIVIRLRDAGESLRDIEFEQIGDWAWTLSELYNQPLD